MGTLKQAEAALKRSGLLLAVVKRTKRSITVAVAAFHDSVAKTVGHGGHVSIAVIGAWREPGSRRQRPDAILYRLSSAS